MCLRSSRDAPTRLELSGARPRPTPWRATRTEASPDFGSEQLFLTSLETDTIYLISNPLARPPADQYSSVSNDDELEWKGHCAAVWPGSSFQKTTVVPLQFPRIEHQPLSLPSSLLEVVFNPLEPHESVLASAISIMSRPGRGQMVRELIRRILRGIP